jgi:hypothetical protein
MSAAVAVSALWLISMSASLNAQGVITLDHAVHNCRLISNEKQRLSCYDRVIDEADASLAQSATPATVTSAAPPAPMAQAAPAASHSQSSGAPQTVDTTQPKKSVATEKSKGDATVIASAKWGRGGIEITTRDGAVWLQIDSTNLQALPKVGDTLSINGSLFGKRICQYGAEPLFDCRKRQD